MLVEYFIDRYARKAGRRIRGVNKRSLEIAFRSYSWPGNIRELQNVIERSVIVCEHGKISRWMKVGFSRQSLESETEIAKRSYLKSLASQEERID